MFLRISIVAILFLFSSISISAFEDTDEIIEDTISVVDTVLFQSENLLSNISPVTNPLNLEEKLTQNPTGALFKSMVIPGWGQLGNKRYLKAGFFFAMDSWMILSAIHYGRQTSDFREKFESITDPASNDLKNEYYALYLDRKDERNKFTWFAVIVSFFSMFDAYVDAHLSGHPKKENVERINFGVVPLEENGAKLFLTFNF